jgi:hypothetical protein
LRTLFSVVHKKHILIPSPAGLSSSTCRLHAESPLQGVPGLTPRRPRLLVLGRAPGPLWRLRRLLRLGTQVRLERELPAGPELQPARLDFWGKDHLRPRSGRFRGALRIELRGAAGVVRVEKGLLLEGLSAGTSQIVQGSQAWRIHLESVFLRARRLALDLDLRLLSV